MLAIPLHAFVDESIRNGYLLSAAVIATGDLALDRGKLRELCKPGQRRLHMKDENDSRRREILHRLTGLELQIHLIPGAPGPGAVTATLVPLPSMMLTSPS